MPIASVRNDSQKSEKRHDAKSVLSALETLCDSSTPGSRIPRHTELMQRWGASERAVREALGEMQRNGRIVRRPRAGTFVADPSLTHSKHTKAITMMDDRTIMVLTKPDYSFFNRCLEMMFLYATLENLTMLCRFADPINQSTPVDPVTLGNPLGFVVFQHGFATLGKQLQDLGHRVVMIGAPPTDMILPLPCVHGDHEQGAYLATNHLLELGHRRLAFAMIGEDHKTSRWTGHQLAICEAKSTGKIISDTIITVQTVEHWKQNPTLAKEYFQQPDAPTGITVWNDRDALGLLTTLMQAGIRVPQDVSLVGYDNLPESTAVYPRLTTVDQGIDQQLRLALRLLTQSERPLTAQTVLVTPTLMVRESTAPPQNLLSLEETK